MHGDSASSPCPSQDSPFSCQTGIVSNILKLRLAVTKESANMILINFEEFTKYLLSSYFVLHPSVQNTCNLTLQLRLILHRNCTIVGISSQTSWLARRISLNFLDMKVQACARERKTLLLNPAVRGAISNVLGEDYTSTLQHCASL